MRFGSAVRVNRKKFFRPFHEARGDLNVAVREGAWKGIWLAERERRTLEANGFEMWSRPLEAPDIDFVNHDFFQFPFQHG